MKNKVIALVLISILLSSIFPINALAQRKLPDMKDIKGIPEKNILDEKKFPSKREASDGLVAHYKFDGNLYDSSSYGNNGKASKGNISYVKGKFGEAAKFDGKTYIEVLDNDSLDLDTTFTFSVWLYKEEVYDLLPVLAKGFEGEAEMGLGIPYLLYHDAAGTMPTLDIHSPDDWSSFAPYELEVGYHTLHMLTITIDIPNKVANHYINGKLVESEKPEWYFTSDKLHRSDENLFIGCMKLMDEMYYFNGFMDDLRIYNRVLTADQISALYIGEVQEQKEYTSIIITPDKMSIMKEKGILNINVIGVKPDGLKEDITVKSIYKSSNASVSTVDNQGKIVSISKGEATITVSNGDFIKQILLRVR